MAQTSVYVDTAKVRSSATTLRNANTKLTEKLEAIRSIMKNINSESTYSTPASIECAEKFEKMASKRVPEFNEIVESYAKFLDDVATTHDSLVSTTSSNLESSVEAFT